MSGMVIVNLTRSAVLHMLGIGSLPRRVTRLERYAYRPAPPHPCVNEAELVTGEDDTVRETRVTEGASSCL